MPTEIPGLAANSILTEWGPIGGIVLLLIGVLVFAYRQFTQTVKEEQKRFSEEREKADLRWAAGYDGQRQAHQEERKEWRKEDERRHHEVMELNKAISGQMQSIDSVLREMSSTMGEIRGEIRGRER